ncbi:PREDICTED: uncharacterized protein LOC106817373 [Priapulus caudatus]|uniref:Uncharacterized protein LOC106817373 n=1 Tax=Priapulus caudatus TaxID=37621 RepID=A0ABM1EZ99_PRICU|nr:PREDICTED: uncharacterized protein LOC106817373 [Priapulus caudatus]
MAWSKTGLTALLAAALVSVATCQDPAISVSPEDTTLLEGTSAVLDCTVTNPQHADITMVKWYRATKSFNSEQIGPGTSYPRYSHVDADYATSGNYALLIDSLVLDEDNFNWKCAIVVAGTTDEIISEEAFLTVAVMPSSMHFYYNTELYNDGGEIQSNISMPFELECKTTDTNPEPSFKWSKRNRATDEITEITEGVSDPLGEAGSQPNLYTFTSHLKIDSLDRSEDDHDFICEMDLGLDDAIDMENDTDTDASNGTKSISIKLGVYGLEPSFEGVIMNTELTFDAGASVTIVCLQTARAANPDPTTERVGLKSATGSPLCHQVARRAENLG